MAPNDDPSPAADRASVAAATMEPGELYVVIRKAVEDAILGVIGTLLIVGVALVLVWTGIAIAASTWDQNAAGALGGLFVVLVGFYVAASALGVVPSIVDRVWSRLR